MYGWRGRIGSIAATPSDIFSYEFYKIVPAGLTIMQTTLSIHLMTAQELAAGFAATEKMALALAKEGADVIVLGGAPTLYDQGPGADKALSDRVFQVTGVPAVSNQTAMMDGLRALGCRKVLIASPFNDENNWKLTKDLEGSGFEVIGAKGLGFTANADINRVSLEGAYRFIKKSGQDFRQAEGIIVPCANWPTSLIAAQVELDPGIPVVTSNLAKIWGALRILEIRDPIRNFGRLLKLGSGL
jgi:maleate cis-trans isomerase